MIKVHKHTDGRYFLMDKTRPYSISLGRVNNGKLVPSVNTYERFSYPENLNPSYQKIEIKTSKKYGRGIDFIVSIGDKIFFHKGGFSRGKGERVYYMKKESNPTIEWTSYERFFNHAKNNEIIEEKIVFKNKSLSKRREERKKKREKFRMKFSHHMSEQLLRYINENTNNNR